MFKTIRWYRDAEEEKPRFQAELEVEVHGVTKITKISGLHDPVINAQSAFLQLDRVVTEFMEMTRLVVVGVSQKRHKRDGLLVRFGCEAYKTYTHPHLDGEQWCRFTVGTPWLAIPGEGETEVAPWLLRCPEEAVELVNDITKGASDYLAGKTGAKIHQRTILEALAEAEQEAMTATFKTTLTDAFSEALPGSTVDADGVIHINGAKAGAENRRKRHGG